MSQPTNPGAPGKANPWQANAGVLAVLIGVAGLVGVFAMVVFTSWKGSDGLAALGVISSPIAAIVGAFFGIHLSGKAAEVSQQNAATATQVAEAAATTAQQANQRADDAVRWLDGRRTLVRAELDKAFRAPSTMPHSNGGQATDDTARLVDEAWQRASTG